MNDETAALVARDLTRSFSQGPARIEVLRGVSLALRRGERLAVLGRSGSGKSTLLHCLGGLDDPDAGEVIVGGESLSAMTPGARARLRNQSVGFVYQFHHLLPEFDAQENVAMPLLLGGVARREAAERAAELLSGVGLAARATHRPHELSGGERQRVAVARALAARPLVVLADEPTGNLDSHSAGEVFDLMCDLSERLETAFLIVTHDESVLERMHRAVRLVDGSLAEEA
ncbi:MAG: ABC transporter ATP-binding protein [Pseudomonadota bacterium]